MTTETSTQKSVLNGLLSPQAEAELQRIISANGSQTEDPKLRAAFAKFIAEDLDAADGKMDGLVKKSVLIERLDKAAEGQPFSLTGLVVRTMARWFAPETLETKTLLDTFGGSLASGLPANPRPQQGASR